MIAVPKKEYLYGTRSSLGETASFGLDFGEVYKRSVIGIRVYGVPSGGTGCAAALLPAPERRLPRGARRSTDYHDGEISYDYMNLNCAKTIGAAFRHGAGYDTLEVRDPLPLSSAVRAIAAVSANIPTEMAMKLVEQWQARGYALDVVLYKKWPHSHWVDPHDDPKIAFAALPDRFPSVLSLDFRADEGQYEDEDNLYAMYLLRHLGRYGLKIDDTTRAAAGRTQRRHPALRRGRPAGTQRCAQSKQERAAPLAGGRARCRRVHRRGRPSLRLHDATPLRTPTCPNPLPSPSSARSPCTSARRPASTPTATR